MAVMLASLDEAPGLPRQFLPVHINGLECKALLDSGNLWRTCISPELMHALGLTRQDLRPLGQDVRVTTAEKGKGLTILGEVRQMLTMSLGSATTKFKFRPVVIDKLSMPLNISASFLRRHHMDQLHSKNALRVQGREYPLLTNREARTPDKLIQPLAQVVALEQTVVVPPYTSMGCQVRRPRLGPDLQDGIIEGSLSFMAHTDLHPCRNVIVTMEQDMAWVTVANTTDAPITVAQGTQYGTFTPVCYEDERDQHPRYLALLRPEESAKAAPDPGDKEKDQFSQPWMKGKTTPHNRTQRCQFLIKQYKLKDNPFIKTTEHLAQVLALLLRYWHVFSWDGDFGCSNLLEHEIHTTGGPPITDKIRPINPKMEESLKIQVDKWLEQGVIQPSKSPWNSALVPARKKDGTWRWCLDYRRLNARTIKDSYPIPNVNSNLTRLAGSRIFSALDAAGAFHSVPLSKDARPKTAFSTPWAHYEFVRLPFGLINGPPTYSRLIQRVLTGIPPEMVLPYLDDLLVHSSDLPSHLKALERVFIAVDKGGIRLQPQKCHLFQKETNYLGHVVSQEGIRPLPSQTEAVRNWSMPNTRTRLRAFIGKISYYRRFVQSFAAIAKPLIDRLSKEDDLKDNEEYIPTDEMKKAFEVLKEKLLNAPILTYPQFQSPEPFLLDTDWSATNAAIGAVLSQKQDAKEKVIAYMAKRLSSTQQNYPSFKGELFAIMCSIKHFDYFLRGRPFVLRIDHQALTRIKTMDPPKGAVERWLQTISNYDFQVVYRPGPKHGNADAMSRLEHLPAPDGSTETDEVVMSLHAIVGRDNHEACLPVSNLADLQKEDPDLSQLFRWLRHNHVPDRAQIRAQSATIQDLAPKLNQLSVDHRGILRYRVSLDSPRTPGVVVVPEVLVPTAIQKGHEILAHKASDATYAYLAKRVYFADMLTRVREIVRRCNACATKTKPSSTGQRRHLHAHATGQPWQTVFLDFVGPLPPSHPGRYQYVLTARDQFTRWLEAFPCRHPDADTVIRLLSTHVFPRFGYCEQLHSDRGTAFTSQIFSKVASHFGIRLTTTPAYNPRSNPVERAHKDLGQALTAMCQGKTNQWEHMLPHVLFAMRISITAATGFSPYKLMFGHEPRCPLQVLFPLPTEARPTVQDYADELLIRQQEAFRQARQQQNVVINRRQQLYKGQGDSFNVGDKVWIFNPKPPSKWAKLAIYWTGPWTITKIINPVTYEVCYKDGKGQKVTGVSIDRIRPYYSDHFQPPMGVEEHQSDTSSLTLPGLVSTPEQYHHDDNHDHKHKAKVAQPDDSLDWSSDSEDSDSNDDPQSHFSAEDTSALDSNDTLPDAASDVQMDTTMDTTDSTAHSGGNTPDTSRPHSPVPPPPPAVPPKPPLMLRRLQPHLLSPDPPTLRSRTRSQTNK